MANRKQKDWDIAEFANHENEKLMDLIEFFVYEEVKKQDEAKLSKKDKKRMFIFLAIFIVCVLVIGFAESIGR